ncbi:cyclic nucleotide-binding domain-containing protein [Streptomyces mobaraensis NBRC 13819 = DSM 40847]|uniref:CRP-like regulatory protein n=1 Tax=Streptomyces mobaraensis (strain ATCC 29032 / DSM 40847 / JCM 4168 / NBRC 13819 / NCIMB 11159 / IPCR 16-22) TaxID=1223523 RepID=M3C5G7_STRM1|nr:cyclic nucleotide-binding domain-containing protein [Streptomyces mobaraensis]EME99210.1 CRP-like regulatory protein [Streptomyces mobaraensis NBRC 13819 = DSM 40847]QTT72068.1 cyclic nucleotide-binding domain-containing protein [Streptomyces mobaraensis NBRC 13819 = DSM 40847]
MNRSGVLAALPDGPRERLTELGREVSFDAGARLFEEGGRADRFWILRTGNVNLDMHVPGRRPAVVETLGPGRMLGWSWLCPPHRWHLGAEAISPVRAWEFDAAEVLALCERDHELDHALLTYVVEVIGRRLRAARTRLLDLYGPYGSGPTP